MIKVAPSLLAADFLHLEAEIQKVINSGADYLHYDVMDGAFVPAISFGQGILKTISALPVKLDVHLMIENPLKQIESFAQAGASVITIHAEALPDTRSLRAALEAIRGLGCTAGASVKPATPISALKDALDLIDMILVMTVEPGKGGQKLIPETIGKVTAAREMCAAAGLDIPVEVDGGVNAQTAPALAGAGATVFVTGSAFFKAPDTAQFVRALKAL